MSRLLITGGSGYLGQHLAPLALAAGAFETVAATFFQTGGLLKSQASPLDVRDGTAVRRLIASFRPDVIIHTIGSNRGIDVETVIVEGTANVVRAVEGSGIRLIHLSTDCVFDGQNPPYDETAVPAPVNAYGRAKARAEAIVTNHPNHVIVRTSLIYGLKLMDHGTRWMAQALRAGQPVTLFDNQVRNPVWADSLSAACLELAQRAFTGVLNVAGEQALTRAEFALKMLDWWGIQERETLEIAPGDGRKWPLDLTLDLSRATAVLTTRLPGVDDVLTAASNPPSPEGNSSAQS